MSLCLCGLQFIETTPAEQGVCVGTLNIFSTGELLPIFQYVQLINRTLVIMNRFDRPNNCRLNCRVDHSHHSNNEKKHYRD